MVAAVVVHVRHETGGVQVPGCAPRKATGGGGHCRVPGCLPPPQPPRHCCAAAHAATRLWCLSGWVPCPTGIRWCAPAARRGWWCGVVGGGGGAAGARGAGQGRRLGTPARRAAAHRRRQLCCLQLPGFGGQQRIQDLVRLGRQLLLNGPAVAAGGGEIGAHAGRPKCRAPLPLRRQAAPSTVQCTLTCAASFDPLRSRGSGPSLRTACETSI